jgi:hypothetical protein
MKIYELEIIETGTSRPADRENTYVFSTIHESFESLESVESYLIERYGKLPTRPVYIDTADGTTKQTGYCKSFWNKDWSHIKNNEIWHVYDYDFSQDYYVTKRIFMSKNGSIKVARL